MIIHHSSFSLIEIATAFYLSHRFNKISQNMLFSQLTKQNITELILMIVTLIIWMTINLIFNVHSAQTVCAFMYWCYFLFLTILLLDLCLNKKTIKDDQISFFLNAKFIGNIFLISFLSFSTTKKWTDHFNYTPRINSVIVHVHHFEKEMEKISETVSDTLSETVNEVTETTKVE